MTTESNYMEWLFELGIEENVLNNSILYDKGYAYFRTCMDSNIDDDSIVLLIKFMIKHNINDTRDINKKMWNLFMKELQKIQGDISDIRGLLENADDMLNIPDLMDFLQDKNNIVLTGGGVNECLKEVELALMALDKPYSVLKKFTY